MLSKRCYDVISVIFILLLISLVLFSAKIKSNAVNDVVKNALNSNFPLDSIAQALENDSRYQLAGYLQLVLYFLTLIYWIFILILDLQFYKKGLSSILDVIVVAIVIPFAIFFYFLSIRPKYKKLEII